MELCEGMKVSISVKALYDMEDDLSFGTIIPDFSNGQDYYDLYNEDGDLACLDGEEVMIAQVGQVLITFRNDNGEGTIYFALTRDECEVAIMR